METHPDPDSAISDGPNMIPLGRLAGILEVLLAHDAIAKGHSGRTA